jgi:hypothetical protein
VLDGEDEDTTSCPTYDDYEKMFQSTNVKDSTSLPVYDADDEDGSRRNLTPHPIYDMYDDAGMIVPEYDKDWELCMEDDNKGADLGDESRSKNLYEEGSPHCTTSSNESIDPLCDIPCHVDEITLHDLENRLLVTEEQIVQVLTRANGAHKFIEDLMWKTQMEERKKGIADGVTSTQLHIIKEALEQMKSDYL